mmetsp:Transcript_39955/g.130596  ORF Transcript_39955/g.130596 Transcript_39955/m.130596 type:complete len:254 (-) Transcript_39955:2394-3155(-)
MEVRHETTPAAVLSSSLCSARCLCVSRAVALCGGQADLVSHLWRECLAGHHWWSSTVSPGASAASASAALARHAQSGCKTAEVYSVVPADGPRSAAATRRAHQRTTAAAAADEEIHSGRFRTRRPRRSLARARRRSAAAIRRTGLRYCFTACSEPRSARARPTFTASGTTEATPESACCSATARRVTSSTWLTRPLVGSKLTCSHILGTGRPRRGSTRRTASCCGAAGTSRRSTPARRSRRARRPFPSGGPPC